MNTRAELLAAVGLAAAAFAPASSALEETLHLEIVSDVVGDEYGYSVASIRDLDNDGIDDLVIGIPRETANDIMSGAVVLASGSDGSVIRRLVGSQVGERFGHSVASLGDIDGDGVDDLVVGAPLRDLHGDDAGVARVYSGATFAQLFLLTELNGPNQHFGWSVAAAGDADGDGTPDIAVGAPYTDQGGNPRAGAAYVYSGATGQRIFEHPGAQAFAFLGYDVAGLGDVNGDGLSELLVGIPGVDNFGTSTNSGRVQVIDPATVSALYGVTGLTPGDEFGRSLDVLADIDSDGVSDFVVGSWGRDEGQLEVGGFTVYSGVDGAPITPAPIVGTQRGELSGSAVAGVGDVDGDGFEDIAAGAYAYDALGATSSGILRVYSGADLTLLFAVTGDAVNRRLGWSVEGGDVDGDGSADLIIGAPQRPFEPDDEGRVKVYTYRDTP